MIHIVLWILDKLFPYTRIAFFLNFLVRKVSLIDFVEIGLFVAFVEVAVLVVVLLDFELVVGLQWVQ